MTTTTTPTTVDIAATGAAGAAQGMAWIWPLFATLGKLAIGLACIAAAAIACRRLIDLAQHLKERRAGEFQLISARGNVPICNTHTEHQLLGPIVKRRSVLPPFEGVTCFVGEPGAGKTLSMVAAALVMHRTGSKVYTNGMGLSFEAGSFTNFKSLMKIIDEAVNDPRPRIVCIDEAPLWVNAKKWAEFPTGLLSRLQQVRKYNVLVYYTCINELGVANELRRVTFWAWHCTRHGNRIIQKLMAPIEQQQPGAKPLLIKRLPMRQEMFAAYNTLGRLNTPDNLVMSDEDEDKPDTKPDNDWIEDDSWQPS